jgi:hypothetical protein
MSKTSSIKKLEVLKEWNQQLERDRAKKGIVVRPKRRSWDDDDDDETFDYEIPHQYKK